jgi:ketosteroid isomerase-like protein
MTCEMRIALFLFYLFSFSLQAQQFSSAVREIVDAENHFSGMAKEKNTRDAFVHYLADSSIVFERGNPVLGKEVWKKRNPDASLLFWWPVFSDVSASGDFGYNTGPFEWSKDKTGSKPVAFGYFSSVWKKDNEGEWKVVIDMGMEMPGAEDKNPSLATSQKKTTPPTGRVAFAKAKQEFLQLDKDYINQLNMQSVSFLSAYFSDEARLHRTGHFPVLTPKRISAFADSRDNYSFEHLGGDMASSGDMAYAYGRVNASDKADQKQVTLNYLRIWKKEGKNWKIVLDVIGG